jgi:hypothetical protein
LLPETVRPPIRAVLALGVLLVVALCVGLAPQASAQDVFDTPADQAAAVQDLPVTLGRKGGANRIDGWVGSGPAVPLLMLATAAMLGAGSFMLWQRCREVAASGADGFTQS